MMIQFTAKLKTCNLPLKLIHVFLRTINFHLDSISWYIIPHGLYPILVIPSQGIAAKYPPPFGSEDFRNSLMVSG